MADKCVIPTSKAKTAFRLLTEVIDLVADEPKRMDMGEWHSTAGSDVAPRRGFPKCGTVGCIGGWCETLKPGHDVSDLLDLSADQLDELCYHKSLIEHAESFGQTRVHANRVIAHIRRFQKKYAAQLKAKRV